MSVLFKIEGTLPNLSVNVSDSEAGESNQEVINLIKGSSRKWKKTKFLNNPERDPPVFNQPVTTLLVGGNAEVCRSYQRYQLNQLLLLSLYLWQLPIPLELKKNSQRPNLGKGRVEVTLIHIMLVMMLLSSDRKGAILTFRTFSKSFFLMG